MRRESAAASPVVPDAPPDDEGGPTPSPAPDSRSGDSSFEHSAFERRLGLEPPNRWIGRRRRALIALALICCAAPFAFVRWVSESPHIEATWTAGTDGRLVLQGSPWPALQAHRGQALLSVAAGGDPPLAFDADLLHASPRWQVDDARRERQLLVQQQLADWLAAGPLRLQFEQGPAVEVQPVARGWHGLGLMFWPLAALAIALMLCAVVVILAHPRPGNLLFVAMSLSQAVNLLFIAIETVPGWGLPAGVAGLDLDLRVALDACTGAAVVHAFALHPRRLAHSRWIAGLAWAAAAAVTLLVRFDLVGHQWWWTQGLCLLLGTAAAGVARRSHRLEPDPYALVMWRLSLAALATLVLVTLAVASAGTWHAIAPGTATGAAVVWYVFLASLLLLTPFLARRRRLLREFAMLAGIATVGTSIDLLLVSLFALGPITSLVLAASIALPLALVARGLLGEHRAGRGLPSADRIFEQLYRAARQAQQRPARYPAVLARLLRDVFDPLEMKQVEAAPQRARAVSGGSVLVVPVRSDGDDPPAQRALVLRYAGHGQRLFTTDDARLADRIVEQLRRAVAYDDAVERGRTEERLRIAQDLHDDIGARLLTLMYTAPTTEMEDYVRHTLQDLKTLTRGLAAGEQRFSHAAAEWKADLSQRLSAAQAALDWSVGFDHDPRLSAVQWSALTRVLRELVSNALYHGRASRVDVRMVIDGPRLSLVVADDGDGRAPAAWSHGLGLGGVRKRVKLLGGDVAWSERVPRGIVCTVEVARFAASE